MYAFLSQCCLHNYLILFTSHKSYTVCLFLVKEDIDPNIDQESNAQKAHRTYLKGRALNVVSDHSLEAEQLLSKAVKLEPNLVDAWIELGECYWKRGDVETAKTCFEGALSHVSNIDELELKPNYFKKQSSLSSFLLT